MAVEFQDYYKTLGVDRNATQEEIQRAYRKLARKLHPDINKSPDAEDRFKQLNEAHEVLKDPEKRKRYDAFGKDWEHAGQGSSQGFERAGGFNAGPNFGSGYRTHGYSGNATGFSDFFNHLFGEADFFSQGEKHRGFSGSRTSKGQSQEADIHISLRDAYFGTTRTLSLQSFDGDENGWMTPSTRTLQVKIPKGVTNGSVIRLAGQGEKGVGGGSAGDLLLRVTIDPDSRFRLEGHDLITRVTVTPWEAILGAKLNVATLDGSVTVTLPPRSRNGKKLRLKSKGMPKRKGGRGDMIVEIAIDIPETITPQEQDLVEKLAKLSGSRNSGPRN